jgi:hypothetical protein
MGPKTKEIVRDGAPLMPFCVLTDSCCLHAVAQKKAAMAAMAANDRIPNFILFSYSL